MHLLQTARGFDWKTLLLGEEEWNFLPEVLLRSAVMFLLAIITVRLIGKRGIMQGVFEIVTIITLGSAAGDPMFYKKVGLLPALLVFATIIIMYRIVNFLVSKSSSFEHLVEGSHIQLIKDNRFAIEDIKHEELSKDEIFSDLRMKGVSHLGQVNTAYIEPSGNISVYFLQDDKVNYGLPVRPEQYRKQVQAITEAGFYSCAYCGNTEEIKPAHEHFCRVCHKKTWVIASKEIRVP